MRKLIAVMVVGAVLAGCGPEPMADQPQLVTPKLMTPAARLQRAKAECRLEDNYSPTPWFDYHVDNRGEEILSIENISILMTPSSTPDRCIDLTDPAYTRTHGSREVSPAAQLIYGRGACTVRKIPLGYWPKPFGVWITPGADVTITFILDPWFPNYKTSKDDKDFQITVQVEFGIVTEKAFARKDGPADFILKGDYDHLKVTSGPMQIHWEHDRPERPTDTPNE